MVNLVSSRVIAVTGSAGYIGTQLLQELENEPSLSGLIAVDIKPLAMPIHKINSYRMDITGPLNTVFHNRHINTVVHLAFDLREGRNQQEVAAIQKNNLLGLENLLHACRAGRINHFVYLSSHTVYGAFPDNPVPITEDTPLRPLPGFQYSESKVRSEQILQRFSQENPDITVTVLRCCMVIGPSGTNYVTNSFKKPLLIQVLGYDPPLQFIHEKDLARLLAIFSLDPKPGVFNVAAEGVIRYSQLAHILGRKLLSLPSALAYPLVQYSWKLKLQRTSSSVGLDLIRYPIVLSTGKLKRTTPVRFQYTAKEAVNSYSVSSLL